MINLMQQTRNFLTSLSRFSHTQIEEMTGSQHLHSVWDELTAEEKSNLFIQLSHPTKIELLSFLSTSERASIIYDLPVEHTSRVMESLEPDDLVDIIQELPAEKRSEILKSLDTKTQEELSFLFYFDEDDAAGLMTSRYLAIRSTQTVQQALQVVRGAAKKVESISYLYIVNYLKHLQGIVTLKTLLASEDTKRLSEIMITDFISVRENTDQEEVANLFDQYDLLALPVVDDQRKLLGIITIDDAIDVIRMEETEDVYKMGAMEGSSDPYIKSSVWRLVRKRIPWLIILLIAGTLTTNLLSSFQSFLLSTSFLVLFIPAITQTGGNSSTQSSTLVIRGIARDELSFKNIKSVIFKEALVSFVLGSILAVVIVLRGWLLPPEIALSEALTVGLALWIVVFLSSMIGALSPLVIHKMGYDPTVIAGPLVSTIIDLLAIAIYLFTAFLLLT